MTATIHTGGSKAKKPYPLELGEEAAALNVLGDKWALMVLKVIADHGSIRFVNIQRALTPEGGGVSTEQLRTVLNRLVAAEVLTRHRYREVPPRVDYALTEKGKAVKPILRALARWGHEFGPAPAPDDPLVPDGFES